MGSDCLTGTGVSLWSDENVLELSSVDGCMTLGKKAYVSCQPLHNPLSWRPFRPLGPSTPASGTLQLWDPCPETFTA